jgi:hypothetical protein
VFEATDGVPRLVNQLCDRAILVATEEKCLRLDRRVVQDAWADLQQLPSPWQSSLPGTAGTTAESVIEFGSLVDEDRPSFATLPSHGQVANREAAVPLEMTTAAPEANFSGPLAIAGSKAATKSVPYTAKTPARAVSNPSDPFDEAFDEEEVLIDSFASMQPLFAKATPPVENRRDASFAALARAAIDAAQGSVANSSATAATVPTEKSVTSAAKESPSRQTPPSFSPEESLPPPVVTARSVSPYDAFPIVDELDTDHATVGSVLDGDHLIDDLDSHWPPIRLAFMESDDESDDEATIAKVIDRGEKLPRESDEVDGASDGGNGLDELPILVVEEDHDGPLGPSYGRLPSGVRRQEYRRLFSRLRSG